VSSIGELITELERHDPEKVAPLGFDSAHSYRGYYERLGVSPAENVTVGTMLAVLRDAVGQTFEGYKGGSYEMGEWTDVHLAEYGVTGDELGVLLLRYMIEYPPPSAAREESGE
jgi:hypothetical protein